MDKKWEIHKRLDNKFGRDDRDAQYKYLNRLVGKSHVAELNGAEVDKVLRKLSRARIVPEHVWRKLGM